MKTCRTCVFVPTDWYCEEKSKITNPAAIACEKYYPKQIAKKLKQRSNIKGK